MARGASTPTRTRGTAPPEGSRELLEYLEIPLRRPFHVAIPFVLIFSAAVVTAYVLPKKYKSSTLILVESEKVPDAFVQKMSTEQASKRLQTIKQEILSRTRIETILNELHPYGELGKEPLNTTVERMRAAIDLTVKGNDAFTIDFIHRDPDVAMKVANRIATLFIQEAANARSEQVGEAYQFIETQLEEARQQLEVREGALRKYKEQHMGTLPEQMAANLSTLQRLQLEQQSLNESLRAAMERLTLIENNPSSATAAASDPAAEMSQLQKQLTGLRTRYTDEHPDVRAVQARIAALQRDLDRGAREGGKPADPAAAAGRTQVERARLEVESLRSRREELDQRIATFQARVELAPRTEQEIATISRDFQKLNENYLALLNKKLEAEMAAKLEKRWKGEQFRILDPANLPDRHVSPNRPLFFAAGLFLGLIAGLSLSVVADFLDHSVKSARELENLLPFPVLAVIPSFDERDIARRLAQEAVASEKRGRSRKAL